MSLPPLESHVVTVQGLSSRGEGIISLQDQEFTAPFVLPGDTIEVELYHKTRKVKGVRLKKFLEKSAAHAKPICQHYATCGGCTLQHFSPSDYKTFKKDLVLNALAEQGMHDICSLVADPLIIEAGQRRRIDFKAVLWDGEVQMGFHEAFGKKPFNIIECPILHPDIPPLFEPLRQVITPVVKRGERLVHFFMTCADNGLDILIAGLKEPLLPTEEKSLQALAAHHPIARLAYKVKKRSTVLIDKATPVVRFGDHDVEVTAFGFLQATKASDQIFADFLRRHLHSDKPLNIIDLFCGRGTLSLTLTAMGHRVLGVECDGQALTALQAVAQVKDPLLTVQDRNLFDHPLLSSEFEGVDAVVMNPPRAGAEAQTAQLVQSAVNKLVYISCNAQSFARDLKTLQAVGFICHDIIPVDQFLWTPHIEVMAYLKRV